MPYTYRIIDGQHWAFQVDDSGSLMHIQEDGIGHYVNVLCAEHPPSAHPTARPLTMCLSAAQDAVTYLPAASPELITPDLVRMVDRSLHHE